MFIANNSCVLRYDGVNWEKIRIKSGERAIRSVYAEPQSNRIYVGLYEEFGYLSPRPDGSYAYVSLSDSLTGFQMHNDEVWNIFKVNDKIYFQTFASFFVYDGKQCRAHADKHTFLYFMPDRDQIFSYLIGEGVHRLNMTTHEFERVPVPTSLGRIIQLKQVAEGRLIVTENVGIYLQQGDRLKRIDRLGDHYPVANKVLFTEDGKSVLVGSIDQGLLCFDLSGELKWSIDRQNGLPDNTVLNLFEDRDRNIWLALNKGIVLLQPNSPLRFFYSQTKSLGSVFGASLYNNRLFLGTNNGVFYSSTGNFTSFSRFQDINAQIWMIKDFDNQLFIGGNQQTHALWENKHWDINSIGGGLALTRATLNRRDLLLQGTYTQICLYEKQNGAYWDKGKAIEGFIQPIRFLEVDYQQNIWAAHIYKGLYRLRLNDSLTQIESQVYYETLTEGINNRIALCKIDNRVVFSDGTQCYIFNDVEQRIVPYKQLNEQLGDFKKCKRIVAARNNRYWFVTDDGIALVQIVNEQVNVIDVIEIAPFKALMVEDEENIISLGDGLHLLCLENGYVVYDEKYIKPTKHETKLQLTHIVGYGPHQEVRGDIKSAGRFNYNENRIAVYYAFPSFGRNNNYQISYALNSDKLWVSQPKGEPVVLQNLTPGSYQLNLKITDNRDQVIDHIVYEFEITPPFYKSNLAKLIYLIVGLLLFYYLRRLIINRFENRRKKEIAELLERQKQEEVRQEQEIIRLQKENLEAELTFKSKELANYAIRELQQKDVLKKIREEVVNAGLTRVSAGGRHSIEKLTHTIDVYLEDNKSWKVFEQNFDLIHEKFFRNLHDKYPALTPNDLRLCAYLRLNLTTKEIADLLHITVKGVEVARYRLRKKLALPAEVQLLTFFLEQAE